MSLFKLIAVFVGFSLVVSTHATALTVADHRKMVERVVEVIKGVETYQIPTDLDWGDPSLWNLYIEQIRQARGKLSEMKCGLPAPYSQDQDERHNCTCEYDQTERLRELGKFRIVDLKYNTFDRNWDTAVCPMKHYDLDNSVTTDDAYSIDVLGQVLGWHAGKVDDQINDSQVSFKGTNALWLDYTQGIVQAATFAPLFTIFAPIYCMIRFFQGDKCSISETYDAMSYLDPVDQLVNTIPGVGNWNDSKFVGLWHMLHADREGDGRYNNIPGTLIERAGPDGHLGLLDIEVMALADLAGATIDARESNGVKRYAQYDEKWRNVAAWQRTNLSHVEFSPVDKLARWGWEQFVDSPDNTTYLGWPLHAFGDVIIPHHLVATTSWGHEPFESALNQVIKDGGFQNLDETVLKAGYNWWKKYCITIGGQNENDFDGLDVGGMIREVALTNRMQIDGEDWPWNDGASSEYNFGSDDEQEHARNEYYNMTEPGSLEELMTPLWVQANGAALAFLLGVADWVEPSGKYEFQECEPGTYFDIPSQLCVSGTLTCEEKEIETDAVPADNNTEDEDSEVDGGTIPIV